jgi:hypothetical protein
LSPGPRYASSCKALFLIAPVLAETADEAKERARLRALQAGKNLDVALARLGWISNIDFSKFDLDAPVGELSTNGHQESLRQFLVSAGFLFRRPNVSRRTMAEITDGIVPEPRRRGLTRRAYAHKHLRDNVLEF